MAEPITRVTLFVPGSPPSPNAWDQSLRSGGLRIKRGVLRGDALDVEPEVEWIENDGAFGQAFSLDTVGPDVIAKLEASPGALVLHWPIDLRDGRKTIVAAVERLRDAGAIAVRIEQSKVGWEVARWLELFSSPNPGDWHRGTIVFLGGDGVLQSCGMHAFSLPDVWLRADGDEGPLFDLATAFDIYQLAERPVMRSGQTFRPDADTARRVVERWPDTQYPPGHPCHNPYGVWRLGLPGGAARALSDLVPVFMPALHVLLVALEQKWRRPLTQDEVEATRDRGVCIAMEPRDAQKIEFERGFSDLDPDLAWEQWQLVRRLAADVAG